MRGQRRTARLVQADRKATVTEITMLYNSGELKGISERTARRTLKLMGYSGSTPVSQVQEMQAAMSTGSPQLDN